MKTMRRTKMRRRRRKKRVLYRRLADYPMATRMMAVMSLLVI
jgi:hypothetical protein